MKGIRGPLSSQFGWFNMYIRKCISPWWNWIHYRTYTTHLSDLINEILPQWLEEENFNTTATWSVEEIEVFERKNVHIKVTEPDEKLSIMALVSDYKTFLRQKKVESILKNNPKHEIGHVYQFMRPSTPRKNWNDLNIQEAIVRKNWKGFYQYVIKKAVACDEFVVANEIVDYQIGKTTGLEKAASSKQK